jgi:hypothetical protein
MDPPPPLSKSRLVWTLQAFTAILTGKELLVTVVDADVIAAELRILRLFKSNSLVRPNKLVQVVSNYV